MADSSRWASGCSEGVWVPWFWCFKTLIPDPHRRSPLTCHGESSYCGSGWCQTLTSSALLHRFREGALMRLSQRVQSVISDVQGPLAPQWLPFWTLKIRALGMAADEYRHGGHCKVVAFKCKWSSSKKSVYAYSTVVQWFPTRGHCSSLRFSGRYLDCRVVWQNRNIELPLNKYCDSMNTCQQASRQHTSLSS